MKKYTKEFKREVEAMVADNWNITTTCRAACIKYDIPYDDNVRRAMSLHLEKKGITNNTMVDDSDLFKEAQKKQLDKTKSKFIVTWCQSETKINDNLLTNIEAYANHIGADISVIAGRYKNPTSLDADKRTKDKEERIAWDKRVVPYLDANRHKVHKHLCILSDLKIQPTASTPLSGINGLTGLESCIIGHPRVHLKSLPVLDGYPHKLLLTTGAISVENYTDTKVGKKGEFHHTLGFVVVELDGNDFHVRQVTADEDGSFYDLELFVDNGEVSVHDGAECIVFGDLHLGETNNEALKTSFELADNLKCNNIVLHDIADFHSISHHELKDPISLLKREDDGSDNLKRELDNVVSFLKYKADYNFTIVKSNHCVFIDRWIGSNDWRKSNNKRTYLELAYNLINDPENKGVLPMYLKMNNLENINCLGINDSYRVGDWELGVHGHLGTNGSRGGAMQFKNLNTKLITGHSHSCERLDGLVTVGTMTKLRMNYNNGLSSWNHANAVIYPNGKTQLIIINKDSYKYTTI